MVVSPSLCHWWDNTMRQQNRPQTSLLVWFTLTAFRATLLCHWMTNKMLGSELAAIGKHRKRFIDPKNVSFLSGSSKQQGKPMLCFCLWVAFRMLIKLRRGHTAFGFLLRTAKAKTLKHFHLERCWCYAQWDQQVSHLIWGVFSEVSLRLW